MNEQNNQLPATPQISNEFSNTDPSFEHLHKALDGKEDIWTTPHETKQIKPLRFSFSGRGKDYLSLWLTNWILTIATLGIYSAWAKVRRLQYIHQNTQLGGFAFGFHGEPQKILIGRIIGICLIFSSNLSNLVSPALTGVLSLAIFALFPWLYRASIRFYTRNSSYRNVRFRFTGSSKTIYGIYAKSALIILVSFGLAFPYVVYRLRRYRVENSRWGNNSFSFSSSVGVFFGIYLLNIVVTTLMFIGIALILFLAASPWLKDVGKEINDVMTENNPSQTIIAVFVGLYFIFIYVVYMIGRVLTQDLIFKESWNHISLGNSQFKCDLSIVRLYFIRYGCFIVSILTLGLFIPFAHMIITKQRIESITFMPAHDFDIAQAVFDEDTTRSAEVAEMLDIDIGW